MHSLVRSPYLCGATAAIAALHWWGTPLNTGGTTAAPQGQRNQGLLLGQLRLGQEPVLGVWGGTAARSVRPALSGDFLPLVQTGMLQQPKHKRPRADPEQQPPLQWEDPHWYRYGCCSNPKHKKFDRLTQPPSGRPPLPDA